MLDAPRITATDLQATAVLRVTVPRAEIRKFMGPGRSELMAVLKAQRITPTGPWFSHHFRMDPAIFDFEIGVPVATQVTPTGRVEPGHLPAARIARSLYRGPYEGLGAAWGELEGWIDAHGLQKAPNLWECYISGPEASANPEDWVTQLNRPLLP